MKSTKTAGFVRRKARISVFDRALLYGHGVFKDVKKLGGYVFKLEEHLD